MVIIWAVIYIIIYNVYTSRLGEIFSQETETVIDLGSLYGKLQYYYLRISWINIIIFLLCWFKLKTHVQLLYRSSVDTYLYYVYVYNKNVFYAFIFRYLIVFPYSIKTNRMYKTMKINHSTMLIINYSSYL